MNSCTVASTSVRLIFFSVILAVAAMSSASALEGSNPAAPAPDKANAAPANTPASTAALLTASGKKRRDNDAGDDLPEEIIGPARAPKVPDKPAENERGNPDPLMKALKTSADAARDLAAASRERSGGPDGMPQMWKMFNDCLENQNFHSAAKVLREFALTAKQEEVSRVDSAVRGKYQKPLAEFLALCYLHDPCETCKGSGMVDCKICGGKGYLNSGPAGAVKPGAVITRKVTPCEACSALGGEVCAGCGGTCIAFNDPSPLERDAYTAQLLIRANECLVTSEGSMYDTALDSPPSFMARVEAKVNPLSEQMWIRDSMTRAYSGLQRLMRGEKFLSMALAADPSLMLRGQKDYTQEINKIRQRRKGLQQDFMERMSAYWESRAERELEMAKWTSNQSKANEITKGR